MSEVGTKNVVEPVIVVVCNADAICPPDSLQPCFVGNIGEGAVAVVLVQAIRRLRRISFQTSARKQKNVCPAVIVVVNESATATVGFEDVLLTIQSSINDGRIQPRRFRDVGEVRIERPT